MAKTNTATLGWATYLVAPCAVSLPPDR